MSDYRNWLDLTQKIDKKCKNYIDFQKKKGNLEFKENSKYDAFEIKDNKVIIKYRDSKNPFDFNYEEVLFEILDNFEKELPNCYICIPISGRESDLKERLDQAYQEVLDLGYNPITPPDAHLATLPLQFTIQEIAGFMGRDIETLIGHCDAIYVCRGWEESKGCRVEIECAKVYGKKIISQGI